MDLLIPPLLNLRGERKHQNWGWGAHDGHPADADHLKGESSRAAEAQVEKVAERPGKEGS